MAFPRQRGLRAFKAQEDFKALSKMANKGRPLNAKQKNQVKKLVRRGRELKYFPTSVALTTISTVATMNGTPFDIAQGVTDTTRVGDRLQWAGRIDLRLVFTAVDTSNIIRFMVVQWHPTSNGAGPSPVPADVLLAGPSGSVDVYSQYNHDNRQNYKILLDSRIVMVGNGTAGTFPGTTSSVQYRRWLVSLKNAKKDPQYQGGGLQGTNRIFLLYVSDSNLATHPTMIGTTKIFFYDS